MLMHGAITTYKNDTWIVDEIEQESVSLRHGDAVEENYGGRV